MTTDLAQKAIELINSLQNLAPQATQLAIDSRQVGGITSLILGCVLLAIGLAIFVWAWRLMKKDNEGCIPMFFVCLGFLIATLFNLADPWNWVAVFQPRLALVHDLMERVLR